MYRRHIRGIILIVVLVFNAQQGDAQARKIRVHTPAGQGMVNLPYSVPDALGQQWMLYQSGWLQQQGNQPLYSQGAMLHVNGNQPNMQNNVARLDDKTGEVIFENMVAANIQVTRRVLIDAEQGVVRYIDILKNTQPQDAQVGVMIQTNLNYGINVAQMVDDPKALKDPPKIAWVAQTSGRSVIEMFAGKGAAVVPQLQWPQGNSYVQANFNLTIPAGKEVALMHFHASAAAQDAGVEFVHSLSETKQMLSLPLEVRKIIVNFPSPQNMVGEYEILRGELFDVIELRSGDQMKGTIQEPAYKLATFYGDIESPVDRVVGLVNVGQYRPRQLLVTASGEVFGGSLEKQSIDLQLSSGQTIQVPLTHITRMGYRKRAGEPEEWTFVHPFVAMRAGDRIGIQLPAEPIEVMTRYGRLTIALQLIASITFQNEEHGVHEVLLTDGSEFAGLVIAEQFNVALAQSPQQQITFPASSVSRLQFTGAVPELEKLTPTLQLTSGDLLVGTLAGRLKLDTAFDTITLNAAEIKQLAHGQGSPSDVQVTLWDETVMSGQLQDPSVACELAGGVELTVPVALIEQYLQPRPQPAAGMVERIKQLAAALNADDWKQRDRAEARLVSMGTVVVGVLQELRTGQPPEAQQRIDSILKKLEDKTPGSSPGT